MTTAAVSVSSRFSRSGGSCIRAQDSFFWPKIVDIYRQVFSLLKKDPTLSILFIVAALLDLSALIFLFLAPFAPVSYILAPIIRTFWSDAYLHYPQNFVLLPKLYNHAHMLVVTTFGIFISGLVIKKVESPLRGGKCVSLVAAGRVVFRRYFSLLLTWLFSYGFFTMGIKTLLPMIPKNVGWQIGGTFLWGLICQSLTAFFMPALLILNKGFFKKVWEGLRCGVTNILATGVLIAVPMALAMVLSFFRWLTPLYIRFCPELVLWVLALGCGLMALVDMWVTLSTTVLFLEVQEKNKK